jgi:membrane-bound lytic murein transglycosylase A
MFRSLVILSVALGGALSGCAFHQETSPKTVPEPKTQETKPEDAQYKQVSWSNLSDWPGDRLLPSWEAWLISCQSLVNKPLWKATCQKAKNVDGKNPSAIQSFFEAHFTPWQILTKNKDSGLITGYYEPLLQGSRYPKSGYTPLYAPPEDMISVELAELYPELKNKRLRGRIEGQKLVPYLDRGAIQKGHPTLKPLVWVKDPVEAFFLEIQGSGRVAVENGDLIRLGYANQNGHPYRSIGTWLIQQKELKAHEASMQGIKKWVDGNPEKRDSLLAQNPSYVFFRILPKNNNGPIGAMGLPLTEEASVAIDPRYVSLGTPLFLKTTYSSLNKPLNRLVMAQDTGGAIKGAIRADFFYGFGDKAGELAGRMKYPGQIWILWPKGAALK